MSPRRALFERLLGVPAGAIMRREAHRLAHAAPPPPVPPRVEERDTELPALCHEEPMRAEQLLAEEQFDQESQSQRESALIEAEDLRWDHEARIREATERLVQEETLVTEERRITGWASVVAGAEWVAFLPAAAELLDHDLTQLHHAGPIVLASTVFVSGSFVIVSVALARGTLSQPISSPAGPWPSNRPALPAPRLLRFAAWTQDQTRLVLCRVGLVAWCLWVGLLRAGAMGPVDLLATEVDASASLVAMWQDARTAIVIFMPFVVSLYIASLWDRRDRIRGWVQAIRCERRALAVVGASLVAERETLQAEREAIALRRRARRQVFDDAEVALRQRQDAEEARFRAEALGFERAPLAIRADLAEVEGQLDQAEVLISWWAGMPSRLSAATTRVGAAIASITLWPVTAALWMTRETVRRLTLVLVELIGHVGAVQAALYTFVRKAVAELWTMVRDAWAAVFGSPRAGSGIHRTAAALLKTTTLTLLVLFACGCGSEPYRADLVIVVDASNSGHVCEGEPCLDPQIPAVFHDFASRTGLPPRSRINVLLAGVDLDVATLYAAVAPPSWRGPGGVHATKAAWAQRVFGELSNLPILRENAGSAVLYAVWAAGELLQESGAVERWLYILSDLRDVRSGQDGWYMPREVPDPARVLEVLERTRSLPRLAGVEIRACGVHSRPPPKLADRWSPEKHRRLVEVWTEIGRASGAASFVIAQQCDLPPALSRNTPKGD